MRRRDWKTQPGSQRASLRLIKMQYGSSDNHRYPFTIAVLCACAAVRVLTETFQRGLPPHPTVNNANVRSRRITTGVVNASPSNTIPKASMIENGLDTKPPDAFLCNITVQSRPKKTPTYPRKPPITRPSPALPRHTAPNHMSQTASTTPQSSSPRTPRNPSSTSPPTAAATAPHQQPQYNTTRMPQTPPQPLKPWC